MKRILIFAIMATIFNVKSYGQPGMKNLTGDLIIFHAGSLAVPFKEIATEFNKLYPDVNILMESAGSVASARKVTDLNRPCDILASSDWEVIDHMLIPGYADWNIKFVSNELAVVYDEKSHYADEINSNNWTGILMKKDVVFGRADPNSDPCGYRTVMTLQLAENFYKKPGLAKMMCDKDQNFMRPKEVDLLALLETHSIDYIFLYRSVAIQHQLKFITLPDEINLKNPLFATKYATAYTEINGNEPGKKEVVKGEPMLYSITMLRNAPDKPAAIAFLQFLLSKEKGMKIMEKNGQPSVIPMETQNYNTLPEELKPFAKPDK